MAVKTDCRYYRGNIPCLFHKSDGRECDICQDYERIEKRILIVKLDAIGDVLRTTSILPPLKSKFPASSVTWITRKNALAILDNSWIDRRLAVEENYLEFVLNESFDLGVCLDADPLSAAILNLAECEEKRGFITDAAGKPVPANKEAQGWWQIGLNDGLKRNNRRTYQEIMYDICGLKGPGVRPVLPAEYLNPGLIHAFEEEHGLSLSHTTIIGINTGGGSRWQWKKWTLENFILLIKKLKHKYAETPVILYGGPEETEFNRKILKEAGDSIIDAGCHNSLRDFISLVSISDILVTPDSLGFHIAAALNKIALVLVGPTSPWELETFGKGKIMYSELDCIACYLPTCDKTPNCMESLKVDSVFEELERHLSD